MTESLQQPPMPPLLTAPVLVVVQRAKVLSSRAEYDVYAPDGTPLGSVHQVPGSGAAIFGQLATIDYDVADATGNVLMRVIKPGALGRVHFEVSWASGAAIGEIEQENLLFAPHFALTAADGTVARLTGGTMMSWSWTIEGTNGEPLGSVSKQFAGLAEMFSSADRFVVELSPALGGALRSLAVVATICLDEVRTQRQQRR
ncbi:MAG TPA: phospholipid scramblase-related protein [Acidothermaceae bacterium]